MRVLRRDFLPGDLEPTLAAHGFDGCLAVQADQSLAETSFLLDLARHHSFIRGVVGWVDLRSPQLDETLAQLAANPLLRGIRHVAQAEADDFLAWPNVVASIGRLSRVNLTYDILIYERQLPAALALTSKLRHQRFIVDHLAKPRVRDRAIEPWARHMRELARRPNVACKLSGLVTEADWATWTAADLRPYLDVVYEAFGPNRVMFGSDWPVCLLAGSYERVYQTIADYASTLSAAEQDALFGGVAEKWYGLRAIQTIDT